MRRAAGLRHEILTDSVLVAAAPGGRNKGLLSYEI